MTVQGATYFRDWPQGVQDRWTRARARWLEVFGNDTTASVWSSRLQPELGGRRAADLVQESDAGLQLVLAELDRLALITTPVPPQSPARRRRRR